MQTSSATRAPTGRRPRSHAVVALDLVRRREFGDVARRVCRQVGKLLRPLVDVEWLDILETSTDRRFDDRTSVEVRRAEAADLTAIAALIGADRASDHFSRGDVGLVGLVDGEVVGCTWLTWQRFRLPVYRVGFEPRPGYVYGTALHVAPGARRNNVGRTLLQARLDEARAHGARVCVSHLSRRNGAAAALHLGLARGRVVGRVPIVVLLRRLGIPLYRRAAATPPESRVSVKLHAGPPSD